MPKNHLNIVRSWDFNCEPVELKGENFVEVSPIPIQLDNTTLSMNDVDKIVQENSKTGDCCSNGGSLWYDNENNCWFTGSRKVAEELVKEGAKVGTAKIRHFVKV